MKSKVLYRSILVGGGLLLLAFPLALRAETRVTPSRDTLDVTAAAFPVDDDSVLLGTRNGHIEQWALSPEKRLRRLPRQHGRVNLLAFASNGSRAFSVDDKGDAMLWAMASGKGSRLRFAGLGEVKAVALSADGKVLVIADDKKTIHAVDASNAKLLWTSHPQPEFTASVHVSPDGRLLMVVPVRGRPGLFDIRTRKLACDAGTFAHAAPDSDAVAFSDDGTRLLLADDNFNIGVFDVPSCKQIGTLKGHRNHVTAVAFSRDGKQAVSAGYEAVVKVWNLQTGQALRTIPTWLQETRSVRLSPDHRRVSALMGGQVIRWDVATGNDVPVALPIDPPSKAWEKKISVDIHAAASDGQKITQHYTPSSGKFSVSLPPGWQRSTGDNGIKIEPTAGSDPLYRTHIKITYIPLPNKLWRDAGMYIRTRSRSLFGLGNHIGNEYSPISAILIDGLPAKSFANLVYKNIPIYNSLRDFEQQPPMKPGVMYRMERMVPKFIKVLTYQKYIVLPVEGGFYTLEYQAKGMDAARYLAEFDAVAGSFKVLVR